MTATIAVKRQQTKSESKMLPTLQMQYVKIKSILNKATVVDAIRRYEMALLIRQVRDGEGRRYGLQAMKRLAKALDYSEELLRVYAMVPDAWQKDAFRKLLQRKTDRGRAISWSHFVQIASVTAVQRRKEWIDRVVNENLSVRDLKRVIEGTAKLPSKRAITVPSTIRAGVRKMTAMAQATVGNTKLWKTAVFDRLREANPADFDEKLKDELQDAHAANVQAENACRATREELEAVFRELTGKPMSS